LCDRRDRVRIIITHLLTPEDPMTDIPERDDGATTAVPRRRKWVWVACGVAAAGTLAGLLAGAVERVRESAARAH
jgi:hypothetical protein